MCPQSQIDERHRDLLIKSETTQMVIADLERYYKGLDKVLKPSRVACLSRQSW